MKTFVACLILSAVSFASAHARVETDELTAFLKLLKDRPTAETERAFTDLALRTGTDLFRGGLRPESREALKDYILVGLNYKGQNLFVSARPLTRTLKGTFNGQSFESVENARYQLAVARYVRDYEFPSDARSYASIREFVADFELSARLALIGAGLPKDLLRQTYDEVIGLTASGTRGMLVVYYEIADDLRTGRVVDASVVSRIIEDHRYAPTPPTRRFMEDPGIEIVDGSCRNLL